MPAPHRSVFYRPDALPAAQPTERSKDHSANVSAADRTKQYKKSEVFEDGGKLFCRSCILGYV